MDIENKTIVANELMLRKLKEIYQTMLAIAEISRDQKIRERAKQLINELNIIFTKI